MKAHVAAVHRNLRQFACDMCGKAFARNGNLKAHIQNVHKNLREYTCDTCGKVFAQRGTLKKHVDSIHKKLPMFSCDSCGKTFTQKGNLKTHINTFHTPGLDDVLNCNSPRLTIRGSRSRQLNPFHSPTTETEYRRANHHLHVLTDSVEPGFELTPSSTPPMGQRCWIEGSNTELLRWTTKNMPEPPQSSFLDGLLYPRDVVAASADYLI
nr:unnamed protein product [Spirometra erinaceieuropaei]